jgi:talin
MFVFPSPQENDATQQNHNNKNNNNRTQMSLTLKIRMPQTGAMKTMRFAENMAVIEAVRSIQEKLQANEGGKDHGLFKPLNEDSGTKGGKWLDSKRTLEYYDMRANDVVEYRKRHEVIKVKLVDNSVKTMLADVSSSVSDLVGNLCKKIGIKNPEEYALQHEGSTTDWVKGDVSLLEQVDSVNDILYLRKKYFVSDANVDKDDPVQLHLVYSQVGEGTREWLKVHTKHSSDNI